MNLANVHSAIDKIIPELFEQTPNAASGIIVPSNLKCNEFIGAIRIPATDVVSFYINNRYKIPTGDN